MDNQNSYFSGAGPNPNNHSGVGSTPGIGSNPAFSSSNPYNSQITSNQNFSTPSSYNPNFQPHVTTSTPAESNGLKPINKNNSIVATIILVVVSLVALTFIGLFIYIFIQWSDLKQESDTATAKAVETAVYEQTVKLENEFAEREKYPKKTFAGPIDYGGLTFEHPRTWSTYVARDENSGGEYEAYLNVDKVNPTNYNSINSLRVSIKNQSFEQVTKLYEPNVKNGKLAMSVVTINGQTANTYKGQLPSGQLTGLATLIKVRDKTIIIQTDALIFEQDYNELLKTIKYNL